MDAQAFQVHRRVLKAKHQNLDRMCSTGWHTFSHGFEIQKDFDYFNIEPLDASYWVHLGSMVNHTRSDGSRSTLPNLFHREFS